MEMSLKEKKKIMEAFAIMHNKSNIIRNKFPKHKGAMENISITKAIFKTLSEDEKTVIENDYLTPTNDSLWYLQYWSKTTYFNIKNKVHEKIINSWW